MIITLLKVLLYNEYEDLTNEEILEKIKKYNVEYT